MKLKTKKCNKCGKENVYGVKKCVYCHNSLVERKSCPRCAKWNSMDSNRCSNCGYSFTKKKHVLLNNLICSFLLIGFLSLFLYLGKIQVVKKISMFLKLGSLLLFIGIIFSIFTYGEKEKIAYSAEEEITKKNLSIFKRYSIIILAIGLILILGVLFYFVLQKGLSF